MQGKKVFLPETECAEGFDRFYWNGYSFPMLPEISFNADGPDKEKPDRLFIIDREDRFMFYFESGGCDNSDRFSGNSKYGNLKIMHRNKSLCLYYPLQNEDRNPSTGYFRMKIRDKDGSDKICCGSLSISQPEPYYTGLKKFTELYTLFTGLEICGGNGGDV